MCVEGGARGGGRCSVGVGEEVLWAWLAVCQRFGVRLFKSCMPQEHRTLELEFVRISLHGPVF